MSARHATSDIAWPEALAAWVERLPMPAWVFYLLLGLAFLTYSCVTTLPVVQAHPFAAAVGAIFVPYFLGARHYLTHAASRAARRFRPLLAVDDAHFARIERDLTTTTAREAWVATLIGAALGLASDALFWVLFPDDVARFGLTRDQYLVTGAPFLVVGEMVAAPFVHRTLRQLRVIQELHASAPVVDPLRPGPVAAFSTLTLRIALVILIPFYAWLAATWELTLSPLIVLLPIVLGSAIAAVVFVVPLLGLHGRLEAERNVRLDVVGERIDRVVTQLTTRVDRQELSDIATLQAAFMSLNAVRDMLLKVQTWPWRPGTFSTFLTVLGVPLILYVVTRLLSRVV